MRVHAVAVAVVAALAGCHGTSPRPLNPAATRQLAIVDDLVVRGEADGLVSVMAPAVLEGRTAYGVVLLPAVAVRGAERSPHVVVARARAWHALSLLLDDLPDAAMQAAQHGQQLLPRCEQDQANTVAVAREALRVRLRCYTRRHRLPASDEVIAIDRARQMIVQRERSAWSVIAMVEHEGLIAAGFARVAGDLVDVASSTYATFARGRAWQHVVRALDGDPERSYQAAARGLASTDCRDDHWRNRLVRATKLYETKGVIAARDFLSAVLDESLEQCVRKYDRRSRMPKVRGRAW